MSFLTHTHMLSSCKQISLKIVAHVAFTSPAGSLTAAISVFFFHIASTIHTQKNKPIFNQDFYFIEALYKEFREQNLKDYCECLRGRQFVHGDEFWFVFRRPVPSTRNGK